MLERTVVTTGVRKSIILAIHVTGTVSNGVQVAVLAPSGTDIQTYSHLGTELDIHTKHK